MFIVALVLAGAIAALVLFLAVYFVCRYSAEEEDGDAWLPRAVVVLTLCAACYTVLLLPLEVALTDEKPALQFAWAWQAMLSFTYVLLCIAGPYAFAFYESWSPHQSTVWVQIRSALAAVVAVNGVFWLFFAALWLWGNHLDAKGDTLTHVSPFEYFVATASAFGWLFFFVFAGVGMAAVPVQGALAFFRRPRPITKTEYELTRARLNVEVQQLLDRGRRLDAEVGGRQPSKKQRQKMLLFKRDVYEVERRSEGNEAAFHLSGAVILRCYVMAVLAAVNSVMSVLWVLHIILANILHVYPLLDQVLTRLHTLLPVSATLVYAYCALYLMWCTVAGWRVVSGHLLVAPLYPLRVRGTMLNALLFNALLLLCAAFAVLHLCCVSFATYASSTTMHKVFAVTIAHMYGVKYVSQYLQYGLLAVFALSVPWLIFGPRCMASERDDDDEAEREGLV